jgi:hypothetical protein
MTFHIFGIIIQTDELIFFRGVGQPPTSIIILMQESHYIDDSNPHKDERQIPTMWGPLDS